MGVTNMGNYYRNLALSPDKVVVQLRYTINHRDLALTKANVERFECDSNKLHFLVNIIVMQRIAELSRQGEILTWAIGIAPAIVSIVNKPTPLAQN